MTISSAAVSQFKSLIWYHLDHDLLETATFFAERLHAYATLDEETQYLLAKCLFRRKQYNSAYHYLRNSSSFSCKFMLARCCIYLEKLEEAEKLLLSLLTEENIQYEEVNLDKIDHRNRHNCPDKSVVYLNLGLVYRKLERQADAEKQFSKCIELNPFHWAAFENICYIKNGTAMNANTYFDLNRASQIANSGNIEKKISNPDIIKLPEQIGTNAREDRVLTKPKIPLTRGVSRNPLQCGSTLAQSNKVLPRVVSAESHVRRPTLQRTIPARARGELSSNIAKKSSSIIKTVPSRVIKSASSVVETELGARRMARVTTITTNPPAPSVKPRQIPKPSKIENITFTNAYRGTSVLHVAPRVKRTRLENENSIDKVDVDKKIKVETTLSFKDDTNKSSNALSSSVLNHQIISKRKGTEIVIDLLRKIGQSLIYLQNYKCAQALETFSSLPTSQFNTGWVLSRVGKAYFELAKYKEVRHSLKTVYFHVNVY
ncbi:anaphase-promoting complex subunit cdc27 [Basidiobolus ranarum]|uniref:Anaphase-promoting complex subunit cdc27 n=1 Tax=Basidiobolus ranarum TaxID=34480 RepID=A0ABR2W964_9FUNG